MKRAQFKKEYSSARRAISLGGCVSGYADRAISQVIDAREQSSFREYWNANVITPGNKKLRPFY